MSFPEVRERGFSIPPGSELFVAVQPTTVFSTPDVVGQLPQRRKCWLPSEKKLKYHANYTQTNCLVECLSEKMEEVCGCVPYYIFKPGLLNSFPAPPHASLRFCEIFKVETSIIC